MFGDLFRRKKNILARIDGIQNAGGAWQNSFLASLKIKLQAEYASILGKEEIFWY